MRCRNSLYTHTGSVPLTHDAGHGKKDTTSRRPPGLDDDDDNVGHLLQFRVFFFVVSLRFSTVHHTVQFDFYIAGVVVGPNFSNIHTRESSYPACLPAEG